MKTFRVCYRCQSCKLEFVVMRQHEFKSTCAENLKPALHTCGNRLTFERQGIALPVWIEPK